MWERPSNTVRVTRSALQEHVAKYKANPKAAAELIRVGESQPDASLNAQELAAWTIVGNLILILEEAINR